MYLNALLQSGSVPKQRRLGFGSWGEHATSWLDELNAQPSLVVRYEDLKQDPLEALRRISVFLGRPVPTTALQAAVTGSDLSAMKRMQEQEIAARTPGRFYEARHEGAYARGLRFVSHGRVGAGLRLPQGALERLGTLWSGPMARLGSDEAGRRCAPASDVRPLASAPAPLALNVRPGNRAVLAAPHRCRGAGRSALAPSRECRPQSKHRQRDSHRSR